MGDGGAGGDGGTADLSGYDIDWGLGELELSGDYGIDTGISGPSSDLGYGQAGKGPDVSWGGDTVAPEVGATGEGGADIRPKKEETQTGIPGGPFKVKKEKPEKVITRAKRRRSLLTEEEGGVLRRPTVYRRSILGR